MNVITATTSDQKGLRGHAHSTMLDPTKLEQSELLPRPIEDVKLSVLLTGTHCGMIAPLFGLRSRAFLPRFVLL
jgi:hypothetical protein